MTWILSKHEGVRYREHLTRKHGRYADRYIVIRYRVNGKRIDEVLGWTSQGASIDRAADVLGVLRQNHRTGTGPQTLAEMRAIAQDEKDRELAAKDGLPTTFGDLFNKYIASAAISKGSWKSDREIYDNRLATLRALKLCDVTPGVMERHKDSLTETYAAASVRHALGLVKRMWRWAATQYGHAWLEFVPGDPLLGVKMPSVKNQRLRYLLMPEVQKLLAWCAENDAAMHDIVLLGIYTGMRRNEMSFLQVGHVDLDTMILSIVDPKSGVTLETVSVPDHLEGMLTARTAGRKNVEYVFPSASTGGRMTNMSVRFSKAAEAIGLNDDIVSEHYRATLHTLRHTFISWAVKEGIDLRTVQEMARHRSYEMTLRYSHLAPRARRDAANRLPRALG